MERAAAPGAQDLSKSEQEWMIRHVWDLAPPSSALASLSRDLSKTLVNAWTARRLEDSPPVN